MMIRESRDAEVAAEFADEDQSIAIAPDSNAYMRELGKQLVRLRRFEDAARVFALLMKLAPQDSFYARCFGICCEHLDRLPEAAGALDFAISADPREPFARVSRASLRLLNGDRDGARADLQVAEANLHDQRSPLGRRIAIMKRGLADGNSTSPANTA